MMFALRPAGMACHAPTDYLPHIMTSTERTKRNILVDTLRLLASREEQFEYRRTVPIADVSAELFCMWADVFWPGDQKLQAEFSETDWIALQRFHSVFERVSRLQSHHPLPPIEEFVHSPHWLQLSRAAARALEVIGPAG